MDAIKVINYVLTVMFFICYSYQAFYILVPFIFKAKPHKAAKDTRFAILISARNEQTVIGNLIDRLFRNYVVDMFDFNIFGYNYPVFNFADICVCVGAFLLVVGILFFDREEKK